MLDNIKEKVGNMLGDKVQAGKEVIEFLNAQISGEGTIEIVDSSEDQTKLDAVTNCPYLEEKCGDLTCPCPKYEAWKLMQDPEVIPRKIAELGIDPNADSWTVMMGMQKVFASRFHNTANMTKEEKDHWINDYLICIEDEIGELLDFVRLPLSAEAKCSNSTEMKKEVIDILHFVMDVFIAGEASPEDIKKAYLKHHTVGVIDVENLVDFSVDQALLMFYSDKDHKYNNGIDYDEVDFDTKILDCCARILLSGRKVRQQISWKHWKKPNASINQEKLLEAYAEMWSSYIDLVIMLFESGEELKQVYIKKNVENILRQELGY